MCHPASMGYITLEGKGKIYYRQTSAQYINQN